MFIFIMLKPNCYGNFFPRVCVALSTAVTATAVLNQSLAHAQPPGVGPDSGHVQILPARFDSRLIFISGT